jgi:hypothetical protein
MFASFYHYMKFVVRQTYPKKSLLFQMQVSALTISSSLVIKFFRVNVLVTSEGNRPPLNADLNTSSSSL